MYDTYTLMERAQLKEINRNKKNLLNANPILQNITELGNSGELGITCKKKVYYTYSK